jgi:hypothetical protein
MQLLEGGRNDGITMTQSTTAALHIQGSTIRYAEVARDQEARDLQRLGGQTFSFDVMRALWEGGGTNDLEGVAEAVRGMLAGLDAAALRVVVHPLDAFSFFAPIPAGLSESERHRYVTSQAALVTGARSPDTLALSLRTVRPVEGREAVEWVHVLALPQGVGERMEALTDALPVQTVTRMVSSEAAARIVGHTAPLNPSAAGNEATYSLAIGQYATHTEYALVRDGAWHHAHATQEARTAGNRAYYAVGFLNRVDLAAETVDRLFVYGPEAGAEGPLEAVFDCSPVSLDPFEGLRRVPDRFEDRDRGTEYVPAIGGASAGSG